MGWADGTEIRAAAQAAAGAGRRRGPGRDLQAGRVQRVRGRAAFDLALLLRSLEHRQNLPAIVVGAEVEGALHEFTRASGGNDYVVKADHFSAVHKVIKRLLKDSVSEPARNRSGTASGPDTGS